MDILNNSISTLSGVGKRRVECFNKLGIYTINDLINYYPRMYEDWSNCYDVSSAPINEQCCIKATVATAVDEHRIRKGLTLYKFKATDGKMPLFVTVFNNRFIASKVKIGCEMLFFGKVSGNFNRKEMSSPQIEMATSAKIRPIYRQCEGLNSKIIEKAVSQALSIVSNDLTDTLPNAIRLENELCHRSFALNKIHFPDSMEDVEIAKKRLVFEELLVLQLGMLKLKKRNREFTASKIENDYTNEFIKALPFEMTMAQKREVNDAVCDMMKQTPMNRLLQGDVGSGKTAVAAAIMYNTAKNGYQSALMAPTEILAEQHYHSLMKMMKNSGITVALLTGSTPATEKRKLLELLKSGDIDILVGTHALIQNGVDFAKLGLVITDEQHRFGVAQRALLSKKGENPHIYVMSATPIPRTLALIVYGDLDVSILDELPLGRQPIETFAVSQKLRLRAYNYVKKHLDEGRQGYIICPMVEDGEMDLASAVTFYEKLKNSTFSGYSVGLLHGKMKPSEKDSVMRDFASGKIQLLVATTVVEVGVDVPNAVIMVIENAERFGLSQLHQLRGRVGRGKYKSSCILISDAENEESKKRLKVMTETTDGFKISDADLKLRGPGDFFGSKQHGLPTLKIANIFNDMSVLKQTRKFANKIIEVDPLLSLSQNLGLKAEVEKLFENSADSSVAN